MNGSPISPSKPAPIKKLKPFLIVKWVLLSLIILLLLAGSFLVVGSYASVKLPLVSEDFQEKVDYWVASIPGIPKTTKQILTKAVKDSENIRSAKENFELELKSGSRILGSLIIETRSDSSDLENISLEARIKGEARLAPQVFELDLSLTQIADNLYFKIDKTPDTLLAPYGYDLTKIKGKWYQLDAEAARKSLGAEIRSDKSIQEDIEKKTDEAFGFLSEEKLFQKFQRLPSEKIAGRDSYHLSLLPATADLVGLLSKLIPDAKVSEEEVKATIKEARFDLWLDKKAFFIDKMEINLVFTNQASGIGIPLGLTGPLEAKLGYQLSEINQKVDIKAPEDSTKINSLAELLALVAPQYMSGVEEVLGISTEAAEFGSNILFLERMVHVVTLFPRSI